MPKLLLTSAVLALFGLAAIPASAIQVAPLQAPRQASFRSQWGAGRDGRADPTDIAILWDMAPPSRPAPITLSIPTVTPMATATAGLARMATATATSGGTVADAALLRRRSVHCIATRWRHSPRDRAQTRSP